jgi:hypothetical protein
MGGFLEHLAFINHIPSPGAWGWGDMFTSFIVWLSFARVMNMQSNTVQCFEPDPELQLNTIQSRIQGFADQKMKKIITAQSFNIYIFLFENYNFPIPRPT